MLRVLDIGLSYYFFSILLFSAVFFVKKGEKSKRFLLAALIAYVFLIISITVISRKNRTDSNYNLIPFWTYGVIAKGGWKGRYRLRETIVNVLMTLPSGILLQPLVKEKRCLKTVLFGFALSACIEVLQLTLHRGLFEIDDLLHNTLGCFFGHGIYRLAHLMVTTNRRKDLHADK